MAGSTAGFRALHRYHARWSLLVLLALLAACAAPALKQDAARPAPSFAMPAATTGLLADTAYRIREQHGAANSGFQLLDGSRESLDWRLAIIDSAVSSLDIVTYLWYPDVVGSLLLERAVLAADRGVKVRLVIDDLLMMGLDQGLADIQAHPNIELRLFNPWSKRSTVSRVGEMLAQMERLNIRMHDKLMIADGHATILGGRNIGDHYFGLSETFNFHDLDVLGIGPIAEEANRMFDHFWNSEWTATADNLTTETDADTAAAGWQRVVERSRNSKNLKSFAREPKDWSAEFQTLLQEMHTGSGLLVYDEASAEKIEQSMFGHMYALFAQAESELLITNAYFLPGEPGIEFLKGLGAKGVDVRLLTNSLESHDVPAVNSHYEKWRKPIINAGVSLYELRANPEISSLVNIAPVSGKFVGLHTKAAVIDQQLVFIGSMNLDPRSAAINTEMGAVIRSSGLATALRELMLRDMRGENSWHVVLNEKDKLEWVNSDQTVTTQPNRGFLQSVMNVVLKVLPKEQN